MNEKPSVLVVDNEKNMLRACRRALENSGYEVETASTALKALEIAERTPFDMALLDMRMPEMSRLEVLARVKEARPDIIVIMMTAYSPVETAIEPIRKEAAEYLTKPFTPSQLREVVEKALSKKRVLDENREWREQLRGYYGHEVALGRSARMREVYQLVERASTTDANVLVSGENGTGKELVSRMIHYRSKRSERPFIAVNCAAIPAALLEGELLGHVRGAFAGADHNKTGSFELAHGGTLFLDEVSEISVEMQAKILRVIQDREVSRAGSEESFRVDVRIISSTSRILEEEVRRGAFRGDLYFRLNVLSIQMASLRERPEDIPTLAYHFLKTFSRRYNKQVDSISREAMDFLTNYPWPGNVRELENAIDRAVILTDDRTIRRGDFAKWLSPGGVPAVWLPSSKGAEDELLTLEEVKMRYIKKVMGLCGGNKRKAARVLGITPITIWRKLGGRK